MSRFSLKDGAFEKFCQAQMASPLASSSSYKDAVLKKRSLETTEADPVLPKSSKRAATSGKPVTPSSASGATLGHSQLDIQLNEKAFGQDFEMFRGLDTSVIFRHAQAELIKAASLCYYADTQLLASQEEKKEDSENNASLNRELALMKKQEDLRASIVSKDEEIQLLKGEKASLADQVANLKKQMVEQRVLLNYKAELAGWSAAVVSRWELIKDFKRGKTGEWNAETAEDAYRKVMISEAELEGRTPPTYPDSYTDFNVDSPTPATQ